MMKLLLSIVFMVMVSVAAWAGPPSLVLVQYRAFPHHIKLTRGAGKTEVIKPSSAAGNNKNAEFEQLHAVLTGLYREGYALQSTSVLGSADRATEVATYVLVKP
ncbi:hypothetical protein [Hymenobacter sp. B1770]|uniref:hypothetical protein n=1 Tax=Hymenobacter sp. B1770 TaxID=1718788 RepID=UPI003CEB7053